MGYNKWVNSGELNVGENFLTLTFRNLEWNNMKTTFDNAMLTLHAKNTDDLRLKIKVDVRSSDIVTNTSFVEPTAWNSIGKAYRIDLTSHFHELVRHSLWSTSTNDVTVRLERIEGEGSRRAVSYDTYHGK